MRAFSKRDLIRVQSEARSGVGRRFRIHIESDPSVPNPSAAPFTTAATAPDPATDILIQGAAIFEQKKDAESEQDTGGVRLRRGKLNCHVRFEDSFRKAYEVEIGGEKGVWEVVGIDKDTSGTSITVYVQGRS